MSYSDYKHLVGLAYKAGEQDCYGLARRYYKDLYGIDLINAARPEQWWDDPTLNILTDFIGEDGWEQLGTNHRFLRPGDGLVFSLITGRANHVGIYVGNGMFIHHVHNRFSCEEPLAQKWLSRMLEIIRHPEVTKVRESTLEKQGILHLLPDEIRRKVTQAI